jgi:hypothetical protein
MPMKWRFITPTMVAGSDSHFAQTVGLGVTEIEAEDVDSVLEAIRSGRTRILGRRTPPKFFICKYCYLYLQSDRQEWEKGLGRTSWIGIQKSQSRKI